MMGMVLGAFATHTFKGILSTDAMESLMTGIRYQIYHVIVLLFTIPIKDFLVQLKNQIALVSLLVSFSFLVLSMRFTFWNSSKKYLVLSLVRRLTSHSRLVFDIFHFFLKKVFVEKKKNKKNC